MLRTMVFALCVMPVATTNVAAAQTVAGWTMSGSGDTCGMRRPFTAGQTMFVVFARRVDGGQFIRVHDARWKVKRDQDFPVILTFGDTSVTLPARGAITDGANAWGGLTALSSDDWQAHLSSASALTVTIVDNPAATIDLAGAPEALAALKTCAEGLSSQGARPLKQTARLVEGLTLRRSDYPPQAFSEGREGTTAVRLAIGVDGKVAGCDVITPSGSADLDAQSCALASARMRFDPALATDGQPVATTYQFRVIWRRP